MSKKSKRELYEAKAERLLGWTTAGLEEMREHGRRFRIDAVERAFFALLAQITSLHDALVAAAEDGGFDVWAAQLNDMRDGSDELLLYLWKARDIEIHATPIGWKPTLTEFEIAVVDQKKFDRIAKQFYQTPDIRRVFHHIFEVHSDEQLLLRFDAGHIPPKDRCDSAGVDIKNSLHSLVLVDFVARIKSGKPRQIKPPTRHMGNDVGPAADQAINLAIGFYATKLSELKDLGRSFPPESLSVESG